jgi:DNA-binding CsgD family transcriptional regulator
VAELSRGELRVLRYLPTNLSRPEVAGELSVSLNTVSTHLRSIYAKLQVRDRSSAVQRARELRLLAAGRTRQPGGHRIPVMRGHLPAVDHGVMDPAPATYLIRIHGHLGATVLSASRRWRRSITARTPCSPACWTGRHSTACWRRSRRSAWTCSRSESSPPTAHHQNQVTAAHPDGHYRRARPFRYEKVPLP